MVPRRIWINLAAFFGLFALLLWWAVGNVISLDQIERPYRITATFDSSPGLQANVAVTYLGVQVGTIDRVALEDGAVQVDLDIERGREIPEGVFAAVRRKSAVGEPYVSLEMPAEYAGDGPFIGEGDRYHIPIERTSVPLSYATLFDSLDELLAGIPPTELEIVLHEVATGIGGRGDDIRTIIESTDDLTGTLAEHTELFDDLADDLTQLTDAIASQQEALGQGIDNVAVLSQTLAASRADIETLLTEAPTLGEQVATLIDGLYPNLSCTFDAIGGILANAGTDENVANLVAVLAAAEGARISFDSSIVRPGEGGADGYYLGGSFTVEAGESPPAYATPATLPAPPPLPTCQAGGGPAPEVAADGSVADGEGATTGGAGSAPDVSDRPTAPGEQFPASSDRSNRDQSFPLAQVLLAFGLALGLVLLAALRPWRLLGIARRDDDETPDPQEPPAP
jgi:phospholipid/cholesterol/gamma-HCH transport system substrate-binding protein